MIKHLFLWVSVGSLMYFGFSSSLHKSTKIDCEVSNVLRACDQLEKEKIINTILSEI